MISSQFQCLWDLLELGGYGNYTIIHNNIIIYNYSKWNMFPVFQPDILLRSSFGTRYLEELQHTSAHYMAADQRKAAVGCFSYS